MITTLTSAAHVVVALTNKPGLTATTNNLGPATTMTNTSHAEPSTTNNLGDTVPATNTVPGTDRSGHAAPATNNLFVATTENLGLVAPTTNTLHIDPSQSTAPKMVNPSDSHSQTP